MVEARGLILFRRSGITGLKTNFIRQPELRQEMPRSKAHYRLLVAIGGAAACGFSAGDAGLDSPTGDGFPPAVLSGGSSGVRYLTTMEMRRLEALVGSSGFSSFWSA